MSAITSNEYVLQIGNHVKFPILASKLADKDAMTTTRHATFTIRSLLLMFRRKRWETCSVRKSCWDRVPRVQVGVGECCWHVRRRRRRHHSSQSRWWRRWRRQISSERLFYLGIGLCAIRGMGNDEERGGSAAGPLWMTVKRTCQPANRHGIISDPVLLLFELSNSYEY